jgi:adenylosuccinate synthase
MVKAIVGGNWGDEGKGKITDYLAQDADIVVRYQGGANAGHTIINNYGKFVLHMLPSGVFNEGTMNIITSGAAVDLSSIFSELDKLSLNKVPFPQLMLSNRAQVVMPYHRLFDRLEEERLGDSSFGSTKAGIAPFYSDKALKIGFQLSELFESCFKARLSEVCSVKNLQLKAVYGSQYEINPDDIYRFIMLLAERAAPYIADTAFYLNKAEKQGEKILLEGQLGALRDPDNGIYPYVTSSSPLAGFASVSTGLPSYSISEITAVIKAYSTCVGAGAFVTEINGEEAAILRERGGDKGEYGASTGRPRRMGWFDTVASKYGCMLQGATEVSLTNLDVLGYLDTIPVCKAYEIDGILTVDFPVTAKLNRAKPVYDYLKGWKCDISRIRSYDKLPLNARLYIEYIEKAINIPITLISNGPQREAVIIKK